MADESTQRNPASNEGPADGALSRREFLGAGTAALTVLAGDACCGGSTSAPRIAAHHIPAEKNLDAAWLRSLFDKGEPKRYRAGELTCIGMPVGGIGAGQLYVRGDGTLAEWGIFNVDRFTGYGENCFRTYTPPTPVMQGFRLTAQADGEAAVARTLDKQGFPSVEFVGEYPIAKVRYPSTADRPLPVEVNLEAFSPFIPLDARESATPCTVLRFTVRNTSRKKVSGSLGGWIRNPVGQRHVGRYAAVRTNRVVREAGLAGVLMTVKQRIPQSPSSRPSVVFADFEQGSYGAWTITGTAFGKQPAAGTLPNQQPVGGFGGHGLVNSYLGGDRAVGTLTSPEFTIERPYIAFRIGGGNHPGKTCMNLVVDGAAVRTATGTNNEKLSWDFWEVGDYRGRRAKIEIVDAARGGWGHINVDDISFADAPPKEAHFPPLSEQPDYGSLFLSVLDDGALAGAGGFENYRQSGSMEQLDKCPTELEFSLSGPAPDAGVAQVFHLAPGAATEMTFLVTWHFVGGQHGRMYANWYADAVDVARQVRKNLPRLAELTRLFHQTYYDSTLPHWLLDRLMMPQSTLATNTVQWRRNGRLWAWEGVGCCDGTCTHVWNYAQGMARLFPELERSVRTMQDLGAGFDSQTGRVGFRGENPSQPYAADGQCGTVLKCYREHLMSKDGEFLARNWPAIKKVMEYEIGRDRNADGVIEDRQWNTYDLDFVGPNTFIGALYLAALEAAARMAELQKDQAFADRCRRIADSGRRLIVQNLWNGEYFVQRIPPGESARFQYGDGCLSDQLFGQTWAWQVGLGDLLPRDKLVAALASIYRYNWAPDVAAQNRAFPPQRWFARPGNAGLFTCTWPRGGRMQEPVLYRDEIWTGIEYQVASALFHAGMIREALSIVRGIHDRYDGRTHNPWNEVECGDHYARALASWGCLVAVSGLEYDGPAGRLGFAPRWPADDFKAFFTGSEGWGSLQQVRGDKTQTNEVAVKHGRLNLRELSLELPSDARATETRLELAGRPLAARTSQAGQKMQIRLNEPQTVDAGQTLAVLLRW